MVQTNGETGLSFQFPWGREFYRQRQQYPKLPFKNFDFEIKFLFNCLFLNQMICCERNKNIYDI